jgi:hypothetical protein
VESKVRDEICREGRGGGRLMGKCYLGLGNILFIVFFYLSGSWLDRFGSVQLVSDFRNRNRTKPEFFCDFLIG